MNCVHAVLSLHIHRLAGFRLSVVHHQCAEIGHTKQPDILKTIALFAVFLHLKLGYNIKSLNLLALMRTLGAVIKYFRAK